MSLYTPPPLASVDFALTARAVPSIAGPQNALQAYAMPALAAIGFALTPFTVPTYPNVGWELLPGATFPTQYPGLRFFTGTVEELCLVALADAPPGDVLAIPTSTGIRAIYLVDPSDPNASSIFLNTNDGPKAARLKT